MQNVLDSLATVITAFLSWLGETANSLLTNNLFALFVGLCLFLLLFNEVIHLVMDIHDIKNGNWHFSGGKNKNNNDYN